MKIIVGLGNPEKEYENTRHNVGFSLIDALAEKYDFPLSHNKKLSSWSGRGLINQTQEVVIAKPDTYMNNSGIAVAKILNWFKLTPSDLIVVHDEIALDLGKIRISHGRGAGGHHGIESIINSIGGGKDFARLRIGIGPDPGGDIRGDYVLGKFTNKEKKVLEKVLDLSVKAS